MSSEYVNPDLSQQSNEVNEVIMCCTLVKCSDANMA